MLMSFHHYRKVYDHVQLGSHPTNLIENGVYTYVSMVKESNEHTLDPIDPLHELPPLQESILSCLALVSPNKSD